MSSRSTQVQVCFAVSNSNFDVETDDRMIDMNSPFPKVANDVPREAINEPTLQFIQENYEHCRMFHSGCPEVVSRLPKRVLDISNDKYLLVVPDEGTKAAYATLSYSWGGKKFCATTAGSYEERLKRGFEEEELPLAFREAAIVARYLDIDYIWIDSLCIVQDDIDDWEEQAAQMGQIFESAAITIAASLTHDPYNSLFAKRNPKYEEFELYDDLTRRHASVVFKARRKIVFGIHAKTGRSKEVDRLDTRAWGLQEKLLSCRLIAFTGAEVQWTCQRSKRCECQRKSYTPQPLFLLPVKEAEIEHKYGYAKAWSRIVEPYSGRDLTFPGDRLPALSGLAKKFQEVTSFTYIAGLWKETIWYDLMWQCDIVTPDTPMAESLAKSVSLTASYMGPTFSWVSVPVAVNYKLARHSYPGARIRHMNVISCKYSTVGRNVLGKAMDSFINMHGPIIDARLRRNSEHSAGYELCVMDTVYQPNSDQRAICEFSIDVNHTTGNGANTALSTMHNLTDRGRQIGFGDRQTPVVLFGVYSIHHPKYMYQNFLILRSLPGRSHTYERVGIGSGKIYNKGNIPAQPQLVQPFDWLSVDFEGRGGSLKEVADRVICLI